MKHLLFTLLLIAAFSGSFAQMAPQAPSATRQFAGLAKDKAFRNAHPDPLPCHTKKDQGSMRSFPTPDGKTGSAYVLASTHPSDRYLIVFHEWWGLNAYIRQMCRKLQHDLGGNLHVWALDLYDGKTASTADEAGKLMQGVSDERARAIIQGAFSQLPASAKIYTIGWCFGGGWSLQAALMGARRTDGCVMYYGMPEKNIDRLRQLHTDVLGIFATQDGWINPKVVAGFEKDMKAAGKKLTVYSYDAVHGFANPSNPRHNVQATREAYRHTLEYFRAHMR